MLAKMWRNWDFNFSGSSTWVKHRITMWPSNSTAKQTFKTGVQTCVWMFLAVFTTAKTWKQPNCLPTVEWINKICCICTMKCHLTIKRNEVLVTLQHGCTLETLHYIKEARHRRPHIVWSHSYEMPRIGKFGERVD